MLRSYIQKYVAKETKAAPLVVFRILFGLLMFISLVRFWWNGWIEKLYIDPSFHFHYSGFDWVQVPGQFTYMLFILAAIFAICISIGFLYKLSITSFFLIFTYIELMDKTTYLNHYYFISVLSFLMIFLPMQGYFSVDAYRNKALRSKFVPSWTIDSIKLLLAVVYIYAGLAKINHDWLMEAMPLSLWLPTKFDIPLIGQLLHEKWIHYIFSWAGMLYDTFIVFFLLNKRTRPFAFTIVVIFHVLTRVLFPIGMFPYIMIMATLIFFSPEFHDKIIKRISKVLNINKTVFDQGTKWNLTNTIFSRLTKITLIVFFAIQILFPMRYLLESGNVFWNEQGYRFSWRVMLMEKVGYANFKIVNEQTGKRFYVQNDDFLTSFQEKQMSTQVDFIIEYAHFLGNHFTNQGHEHVQVFVESYASLNSRKSQMFVKDDIDLLTVDTNCDFNKLILRLNE